ncbi:transient receptor potential cation channel subfamily V member 6-like [Amphiura filiformis]|uniref:transient receptor potential cation channel subfamily V member 6-like n=1 Tax=Amphiura filiformis TaxID=82378 RepID=UPI003B20C1D2
MTSVLRALYRKFQSIWPWNKTLVEADADTVWKRSNDTARRNIAYKLVNIRGNGELQRIYRNDGADALREHIRWALPKYLYHDGRKVGVITRMEFARYRHRLSKKGQSKTCRVCDQDSDWVNVTVCDECGQPFHVNCLNPILSKVPDDLWFCSVCKEDPENLEHTDSLLEEKLNHDETVVDLKDHPACWNLKMRGVVGETPLHICYLSSTDDDKAIAKIMLEEFPYLVHDIYEGTTFFGENVLHFAIVKRDMESAKLLLQHGVSLVARGRGTFFQPSDIQNGSCTKGKTNFKGNACYGEYPLAFAASLGLIKMYDYFIKQSKKKPHLGEVNPNAQDSFGNTVLHWCVIHKQKKMYKHALRHPVLAANQYITNDAGLTPLALACRLGHCDMFTAIVDYSSKPLWTHGVTCLACPLDILDSIDTEGVKNESSALRIIVKGSKEGHFKMLESSVVARLLDEKWRRYIKKRFMIKFAWILFTSRCCLLLHNSDQSIQTIY